jgi:hypothetical protein
VHPRSARFAWIRLEHENIVRTRIKGVDDGLGKRQLVLRPKAGLGLDRSRERCVRHSDHLM